METLLVQLGNKKYVCDSDYSIELQYRLSTKCPTTPVDGDREAQGQKTHATGWVLTMGATLWMSANPLDWGLSHKTLAKTFLSKMEIDW